MLFHINSSLFYSGAKLLDHVKFLYSKSYSANPSKTCSSNSFKTYTANTFMPNVFPILINWASPFPILGLLGGNFNFIQFFKETSVSKQRRT